MLKNIVLTGVLSLSTALPVLAKPYPVYPTESEFLRYEYGLASFFNNSSTAQHNSIYIRKSDRQRRFDGQIVCGMLTDYSVGKYLSIRIGIIQALYRENPKKMTDELAYLFGVTASAIDNMCSENRAEFMDFVDELKRKGFSVFQ
ncbi:MAG: hypothetical protein ACK53Q_14685 [Dolichospermum sp.]|jgi:hypothetical protein